jgi:hypothetical protein
MIGWKKMACNGLREGLISVCASKRALVVWGIAGYLTRPPPVLLNLGEQKK